MARRYKARKFLAMAEQNDVWARWRRGETAREIGGTLCCSSRTAYLIVARWGGVAPVDTVALTG